MAKTEMKKDREAKGIFKDTAKSDTIKRVLKHIGAYRWLVLLSLVLSAVTVALTLYIPILIGQAVDLITGEGQVDFDGLFRIFGIMAAVILVTAAGPVADERHQQSHHLPGGYGRPGEGLLPFGDPAS